MKRHLAALFCLLLPLLSAVAQTAKPAATPAKPAATPARPAAAPALPAAAGAARPSQPAADKFTGHLSPDPAQFIADVGVMLNATANANAKAVAERLRQLWGSNALTASQQRAIAALSQQMLDKKLRPVPQLVLLYTAVLAAKGHAKLSDAQTDQYLDVVRQSVEHDPAADVDKYLQATARLLNTGVLYKSGFNSLRVAGGALSFTYQAPAVGDPNASFDLPAPAAPVPAELPAAPKPTAKAAAPAAAKPKAKPVAKKKRASDGWDTADMWGGGSSKSSKNDGWGSSNDGWGTPVKSSANDGWGSPAPKKKTAAKPVAKAPAAKPAAPKPDPADFGSAAPTAADFDQASQPFVPSPLAAFSNYYPPQVSGPTVQVKEADLVMGINGDSVVLRKVSGQVATSSNRFVATGGQLAWTIKGNPVTADLAGFDFDYGKPEFTAQPVTLTYPALLDAPAKGALSYKLQHRKAGAADSGYPRFISLTNDVVLKDLGPGIAYRGGLSLAGSRLLSAALDGSTSRLTVSQDGKPRFRADSRNYTFSDSIITADRAAVALFLSTGDSLTHPGVVLKYLKRQQQLKLVYNTGTYRDAPYSDSYHQVDIRAQLLTWNLRDPTIELGIITSPTQVPAEFESKNFFSNVRYQQLTSINHLHPLQLLVGYSQKHGNAIVLNVHEVATELKIPESNLRAAVTGLAREGYVNIRPQTGEVILLRKTLLYVGAAREKKDFDNIDIKSLSGSGRSATLNLSSNQLLVRGVKQFSFSNDSTAVKVLVQPDSALVRLERNRNLKFGGRVKSSIYTFKGRDFIFDYDGYFIDMPHIDSLSIRSQGKKKASGKKPAEHAPKDFVLANKGSSQSGRLYLDDPGNRSGRKKMPKYPSFSSTSGANVYFNKTDVLGGAYDSSTYFDVPPFKLDSMGTAKAKGGFAGVFHSKALPPIKTALVTQDDGTLGFVHEVPAAGYALYGGKGKLAGGAKVHLDGQGLQSNGTVTYLGATLQSDRFVLYGDSLTGVGKAGTLAAGPSTPKVTLPPGYLINWGAKSDSLALQSPPEGAAIKMYADHTFKGSLLLTPTRLGGAGRLDGPQSYVRSDDLTFKNDVYSGRKGVLSVKSAQAGKPALTATDVDFTYDMKKGVAEFKRPEGGNSSLDLPYTGMRTTLGEGRWDFKRKHVTLQATDTTAGRALIASTLPEQEGLKFQAASADYDIVNSLLKAKGVRHIASADAWILPDSGNVTVAKGGKFRALRHARVLLDSVSRFHRLTGGTITVESRKAFSGSAMAKFRSVTGDSTDLKFSNFQFGADSVAQATAAAGGKKRRGRKTVVVSEATGPATLATANVSPTQKLPLAPRIDFRGDINLNSQVRGLVFDGLAQLQFGKPGSAEWFVVKDSIDTGHLVLPLRAPKAEDGTALATGLFISDTEATVFPLYAGTPPNAADIALLDVKGDLRYDSSTRDYTISDRDPSAENAYAGTVLTYHGKTTAINFQGPLHFIKNKKQFALNGAGVGSGTPDSARYQLQALLTLSAQLPGKALEMMAADLAKATKGSSEALDGSNEELTNLAQFAGDAAVAQYAQHQGVGRPALATLSPKTLATTLVLGKVDLRWSARKKAWFSADQVGLNGVGKQSLNALITAYVEIRHEEANDIVNIYLEPDPSTWYYLHYANNVLTTTSSNSDYVSEISNKQKGDASTALDYGVFTSDWDNVDEFRAHYQRDYLGKSGKLAARPEPASGSTDAFGEDTGKKKKKKGKESAALSDADLANPPAAPDPSAEPTADTGKKKKKAKANDPFGDGVMDTTTVAEKPAKKAKAKKQEVAPDVAADPAATPAPDASAEPTADTSKKAKKKKQDEADNAPIPDPNADPVADPTADTGKKAKKKKQEADAAAPTDPAPDPNADPPVDTGKKKKKKDKDKAADDPFSGQ